ncbi:MAG: cytidylate kinase-like family protein [Deltaproteobacteria bacterium]|nr:cytidylate kinase-like family protein [Deltaproteobacteria bacterium]
MAVITISRQFGAGGRTLGEAVARRLGYQFVSQDVVNKIAEEAHVSIDWVRSMEKEAGGLLMRLASRLVSSDFIDRHIGEDRSDFDEEKYAAFLKSLITSIAASGNVVFLGRGSQFILANRPDIINILLVADFEDRINFISEIWDVKKSEAEQTITARQKRRKTFLKAFDPRDPNDPSLYHLVINISRISLDQAEEMIIWLVEKMEDRPEQNETST